MLSIVKQKLITILTDNADTGYIKSRIHSIVEDIEEYEEGNKAASDVHNCFRALDEYLIMYNNELEKYGAISRKDIEKCSYQIQEMLCILALMGSLILRIFKKYNNGGDDRSTLAKHLRKLNELREYVQSEKILWQSSLKSYNNLITLKVEEHKAAEMIFEE